MTTQLTKEESHLDTLALVHYIIGGVMALFACIPLIHFSIGLLFVLGGAQGWFVEENEPPPPSFIGWMFMLLGLGFFLFGQAIAISIIISGRFLKKRIKYMFSFIMACVACFFMPFGTILGVFTIIVMIKPETKAIYKAVNPQAHTI